MNIKAKWMLLSFILILAATFVTGTGEYYHIKDIMIKQVNTEMERSARESADQLDNYINQFVTPLLGLSKNGYIKSMNWLQQKTVIKDQIYPQYLDVAVVDLQGKAHYIDETSIDLSDREYVQKALKGDISYSNIIISRKTNKHVIMIGVPIQRDDKIVGAIIARLDVKFLSNYSKTSGYGQNGKVYVLSEDGGMISRPEEDNFDNEYNLFNLAKANSDYESFASFVKENRSNQTGYGEYEFHHNKLLMGYATVEKTDWKVYIGTNQKEILKSLLGLKELFLFLILLTLIACTFIAWIFVNKLTKPIEELDHLFYRGSKGDLTIRFTPKTKDEIGRLGISFNRMMDKIKTLTQYDPLTGLLNQFVLQKDIDILSSNKEGNSFTLIMAAIDRLSFINDTYGYTSGDDIIIQVAKRICSCTTEENSVYRYKGDEFVILYPYTPMDTDEIANSLMEELSKSYLVKEKAITVNISMGIFTWDESNMDEDPLTAVTEAKNYAKVLGIKQIQRFDKLLYHKNKLNKELQADILNGLKENQFFLVYQPLFNLSNEKIAELEALIRWNHPEKGLLYPDKFIDLAETSGTIIDIDKWVLETACGLLKSRKESGKPPIMLSVNISSKTFETREFVPNLLSIINRYSVDPSLLQLEITERMFINNMEESIYKLSELRALGIKVAIDDFGIGYSSLSYIVRLPIDSIKIDKSFVQNITSSEEAKAIVSTIISLCKTLRLNVIAEGIEQEIELDYLRLNQCDIGQGYYFSKPVSINEIETKHFH